MRFSNNIQIHFIQNFFTLYFSESKPLNLINRNSIKAMFSLKFLQSIIFELEAILKIFFQEFSFFNKKLIEF